MIRQDYIQRVIEELGRAIAALSSKSVSPEETLQQVTDAKRLIPLTPGLIDTLGARDIVVRLDDQVVRDLATLLRLEGEAHLELGNERQASRLLRRSGSLLSSLNESRIAIELKTP